MTISERIEHRISRIAVIGQGYVGLPLAVEFAKAGFVVAGIDRDLDRVSALAQGQSHTSDVESSDVAALLLTGRYMPTADFGVLQESDVVIICVPTPLRKSKDPDISYVVAAGEEVAARFRPGQLIVLESTTYPGTTEELLLPLFEARGGKVGNNVFLAFSPERIDPANPHFKVGDIAKVVGGITPECTRLAALLYRQIIDKVVEVSSPKVAELAKLYENTFRNVNIALANEFSVICRHLGVSVWDVIDAAATKPFGFMPFYPGPGIGGHCIPIDPFYLSWKARLNGYEAKFIGLADEINQTMPRLVIGLLTDALNERGRALRGTRILVLGAAYKRGVGDVRESPALEILEQLIHKGADVQYADPHVPSLHLGRATMNAVAPSPEVVRSCDAVIVLTDHAEFDYPMVVAEASLIVDTRNATRGLAAPQGRIVRF